MRRSEFYQTALVITSALTAIVSGFFLYREIFPEYKIYQNTYEDIERFRSNITGVPQPEFKTGIKQIMIPREDNGPEVIDRCISCHVAMQLPHFSTTRIAQDINGNLKRDAEGYPILVQNEDSVWNQLDDQVQTLISAGKDKEAQQLKNLRYKEIDGHLVDMSKVLRMHPLIGFETRPFENHPLDDFGCTSCHSGNGRSVVMSRAHGPVFDDRYEISHSYYPPFMETDPENDPKFARVFNSKPGADLLFQTNPLLVGPLMQARCVQCHVSTEANINRIVNNVGYLVNHKTTQIAAIDEGYENSKTALISLLENYRDIITLGIEKTLLQITQAVSSSNYTPFEIDRLEGRREYLRKFVENGASANSGNVVFERPAFEEQLMDDITEIVGTPVYAKQLMESVNSYQQESVQMIVEKFLLSNPFMQLTGSFPFSNDRKVMQLEQSLVSGAISTYLKESTPVVGDDAIFSKRMNEVILDSAVETVVDLKEKIQFLADEQQIVNDMKSPVDRLIVNYNRGLQLYITNACYACHRITGLSRGSVGPELTAIGLSYPWYVKASIVWPQGKLADSQMPTFGFDHVDVQDLMTFMMAQRGHNKTQSEFERHAYNRAWEAGQKLSWEEPLPPAELLNNQAAMNIFATQGCAGCHRLEGFSTNVGFQVEKGVTPEEAATDAFKEKVLKEREWFTQLIPENISGMDLIALMENKSGEIDQHLIDDVRKDAFLDLLEETHPHLLQSYYANFQMALRAKNSIVEKRLKNSESEQQAEALHYLHDWKERTYRVMKMYIHIYGLGRLVAPRLNWSGVYRSNEWLVDHFHNPGAYSARSIMPVFPFDNGKFYTLSVMLHKLGEKNRDEARMRWNMEGFNPEEAFKLYCSSCHGDNLQGNGPVSRWIYPVPKNLRNSIFLQSLTRKRAAYSITHGIKGTPMPPWGESLTSDQGGDGKPVLTQSEISQLVDWIFRTLPPDLSTVQTPDVAKWRYSIQNVINDMTREGLFLKGTYASPSSAQPTVEEYFFVEPNTNELAEEIIDKNYYYIKPNFYTQENIDAGKLLFTIDCAHCHGSDAGGMGPRAAVMVDAKPRMLANFPWMASRDDLRLIRSIKFGVPGTAMTPWGDQLSIAQQMQLAIYIRSLTKQKSQNDKLTAIIYHIFTEAQLAVDEARKSEYEKIADLEQSYRNAVIQVQDAAQQVESDPSDIKQVTTIYAEQLEFMVHLAHWKKIDKSLVQLKDAIKQEESIYDTLGSSLIIKELDDDLVSLYVQMLNQRIPLVRFEKGTLICGYTTDLEELIASSQKKFVSLLDQLKNKDDKLHDIIMGQLPSPARQEEVSRIELRRNALIQLRTQFISQMKLTKEMRKKECELVDAYKSETKTAKAQIVKPAFPNGGKIK